MSDIIAKLQWWMSNCPDDGSGYLMPHADVKQLMDEVVRLRRENWHLKSGMAAFKEAFRAQAGKLDDLKARMNDIPWGQEVPVLTFEQIRDLARKGRELKGADG